MAMADAVEIDGIYYNLIDKGNAAEVTSNPNKYSGSVAIPEKVEYEGTEYSVTNIGKEAFKDCTDLYSVNIAKSVTKIGAYVFSGCTNLGSIIIPNGVEFIEKYTFYDCSKLSSVTIPSSVTKIGEDAFAKCASLIEIEIPNSVISIGYEAFCLSGIISINLPNSLTILSESTFSGCTGLTSVYLPNTIETIAQRAFYGCTSLTSVTIPASVTEIGNLVFGFCGNLKTVNISNNVISIGSEAFEGCSNLTNITIPNGVTSINDGTFKNCKNLIDITLPDNLNRIGNMAFQGCNNLSKVSIPNSVTSIGNCAFEGCTGLTSIVIPINVNFIGYNSFENCSGLTTVIIGSHIKHIGSLAFSSCIGLKDVYCYAVNVPSEISNDIFKDSFIEYSTLHVPLSSINSYLSTEPWNNFKNIINIETTDNPLNYVSVNYPFHEGGEGQNANYGPASAMDYYFVSSYVELGSSLQYSGVGMVENQTLIQPNQRDQSANEGNAIKFYFETKKGMSFTPNRISFNTSRYGTTQCLVDVSWIGSDGTVTIIKNGIVPNRSNETPNITYVDELVNGIKSSEGLCGLCINVYNLSNTKKIGLGDILIEGTLTGTPVDYYKLNYIVDDKEYKTYVIEEGTVITPEPEPTKEGYTFSGWSEIPEVMPAHDVTVTGSFTINKYKLIYQVDGEEYKSCELEFGATITPESAPAKEGYTFSGWSEIPETMPAHDVIVRGVFAVNQYTITYMIDNEVFMTDKINYGSIIIPPSPPDREGYVFVWGDYPDTMPAHDITIYGTYITSLVIPGDVNSDGEVNVGDIVTISNVMAGKSTIDPQLADVNKDGEVNVGDIVTTTNIMAGKDE